jgi:hypothetical protein
MKLNGGRAMAGTSKETDALTGKCNLCGRSYSRRGMTRHVTSCLKKHGSGIAPGTKAAKQAKAFHLVVEDRYLLDYRLHLLAPTSALLEDLDSFLRWIWVECCDHLSEFLIGQDRYAGTPAMAFFGDSSEEDLEDEEEEEEPERVDAEKALAAFKEFANALGMSAMAEKLLTGQMPKESDMNVSLGNVLQPKMEFGYTYDFGTSTELILKVVSEVEAIVQGNTIQILARNDPPDLRCLICDEPAVEVCTQCMYDEAAYFCRRCGAKHECGEEVLLPVVNSPRMGMCAYCGPGHQE